jgi:23S rRNA pseudouridine2605 synthase
LPSKTYRLPSNNSPRKPKPGASKAQGGPKKFSGPRKPIAAKKPAAAPRPEKKADTSGKMRLNRFIAHAGICSRREADTYIKAGSVTVNGKVVSEMGYQVSFNDEVRFDGRLISSERKEYVLLNKPKNFLTTTSDDKGRRTVMELIASATKQRLFPVGRLDRNTTGLLLFTNDGELAARLTHPKYGVRKIYHVVLDKTLRVNHLQEIEKGITLEDGPVVADAISFIQGATKREVGIEIHSGKNRIVRRIFEHFGYEVTKLDRVSFAGLTKKDLPRGHFRHLTEKEVSFLRMIG